MRRTLTIALAILAASCVHDKNDRRVGKGAGPDFDQRRFEVTDCEGLWVLEEQPCADGSRRVKRLRTGCVLADRVSACRVGVLRILNEDKGTGANDFVKPDYVYGRLYDWECPAGVSPPPPAAFPFATTFNAPVACDDEEPGSPPTNPLLRKRAAPKPTSD